jgi:hypothetical protein
MFSFYQGPSINGGRTQCEPGRNKTKDPQREQYHMPGNRAEPSLNRRTTTPPEPAHALTQAPVRSKSTAGKKAPKQSLRTSYELKIGLFNEGKLSRVDYESLATCMADGHIGVGFMSEAAQNANGIDTVLDNRFDVISETNQMKGGAGFIVDSKKANFQR